MEPANPPGAKVDQYVIDHVTRIFTHYIGQLDAGKAEKVLGALRSRSWRTNYEWRGVPDDVMRRTDELYEQAKQRLDEPDPAAARGTFEEILALWASRA